MTEDIIEASSQLFRMLCLSFSLSNAELGTLYNVTQPTSTTHHRRCSSVVVAIVLLVPNDHMPF